MSDTKNYMVCPFISSNIAVHAERGSTLTNPETNSFGLFSNFSWSESGKEYVVPITYE